MKDYCRLSGWSLVLLVALVFAACGKKTEEAATAEETAAAAGEPAAPSEDLQGTFRAKVAEVDEYMKAHDVTNTAALELAAKLEGFQNDFEDLAAKAGGDEKSAAQFNLAAEAMALYVKSLRAPPGDMSSLELAIDAEAKWTEAKEAAAVEPET